MMTVPLQVPNDIDAIRQALDGAISRKRWVAGIALVAVAVGMVLAGYVIVVTYGASSAPASTTTTPSASGSATAHP